MSVALPTLAEIDQIAPSLQVVAPPEWEDLNGHVNVNHYYRLHMECAERAFAEIGLDEDYPRERGLGAFSMEQHLTYLGEVHVGEEISAHLRVLGRSEKLLHAVSIIVNRSTGAVANTLQAIEGHVDLTRRRTTPFPADIAARLDGLIEAHQVLTWGVPLNGAMGLRRA